MDLRNGLLGVGLAAGVLFSVADGVRAIDQDASRVSFRQVPFGEGEKLVYSIGWHSIIGGIASLEVKSGEHNGVPVFRILSLAESTDFVSLFFPVEDRIESVIDRTTLGAMRLDVKQRHGKRRRERLTEFDQINHTATVYKNGAKDVYETPAGVQDSLSCLYYFRSLPPIRIGETVVVDVHEGNKTWQLGIEALSRERVKTGVGEFVAIKTKAKVEFEGVMMDRGDVYVWFSDDERRLPVRVESKIKIGSIRAKLIDYTPPRDSRPQDPS